jgi:hypothetical protein
MYQAAAAALKYQDRASSRKSNIILSFVLNNQYKSHLWHRNLMKRHATEICLMDSTLSTVM